MKPVVAIVGRPNVGKSTLFNRLTRSRTALVDDFPGVTRDRIYGDAQWGDLGFTVVDTGGYCEFESELFAPLVRFQVMQAMNEADAIVLLFDGRQGVTPADSDLVQRLRQSDKPVFHVVNKIDGPRHEALMSDFSVLGVDRLFPLSAEHRYGMDDLMDALAEVLPRAEPEGSSKQIRLAVIGRPNVGKSSLINRLLGDQRLVVSDIPGTTRDAVDTLCTLNGRQYLLIDTAGIRRKKSVRAKLEKFSIIKALSSLNRCHIALLVLDAEQGIRDQDVRIGGYVWQRGRGCVILLNKWDLVEKDSRTAGQYLDTVRDRMRFLRFAPAMTVSALTGQRTLKIFDRVHAVYEQYTTRVGTGPLNRVLEALVANNPPAMSRGRRIKFYYATQTGVAPPTFVCFVNDPEGIHFSYERYMLNRFREALGLNQTPIRLTFRKRKGKGR